MNSENIFTIAAAITLCVLFICFTVGQINGNSYYYKSLDNCVTAGGTWVPTQSIGMCLMTGVIIRD